MTEILNDPLKLTMLIILAALEIPAAGFLVYAWVRDKRRYRDGN